MDMEGEEKGEAAGRMRKNRIFFHPLLVSDR